MLSISNLLFSVLIMMTVMALSSSSITQTSNALPLKKYPSLQCSMCKAVIEIIGDKMNETAAKKQTILKSHRLESGGVGDRRIDYESSELRGYEILENLCSQNNFGSYMLREERRTGLRIFSKEAALQQCLPYDDRDRKDLHDTQTSKYIHKACEELVEEHEEHIVGLVKKLRTFNDMSEAFCGKKTKLCAGKRYDKGVKEDLARRAAWRKRTGIRTGTDVDNDKEAEEKKKKEDEEAAKFNADGGQQIPHTIATDIDGSEAVKAAAVDDGGSAEAPVPPPSPPSPDL